MRAFAGGLQVKTDEIRTADQGALMHVLATTVEALVVVCGHGPACEKAALDHIIAVDPPSAKVQLEEVLTLTCPNAARLKQAFCAIIPQSDFVSGDGPAFAVQSFSQTKPDDLARRKDATRVTNCTPCP